jgi:release factor glutamine methyltransferase
MIRATLRQATAALAATSGTPRLDAELLMAHALGISREALLLGRLDDAVPAGFAALLARRADGEPIAYITGTRDFWTITLTVRPGVLIPRADSETLIDAAVDHFAGGPGPGKILDLGTGSGALLLAALAEWPKARGVGVDASDLALAVASENAARLGIADRARMIPGGWTGTGEAFDLVLCNPPYVRAGEMLSRDVAAFEPASALYAGADGLDDYRALAPVIARQIAPGGIACVEIGADQGESAGLLFKEQGLQVKLRQDLGGRDRCLLLQGK